MLATAQQPMIQAVRLRTMIDILEISVLTLEAVVQDARLLSMLGKFFMGISRVAFLEDVMG
jgi:hypothetical protein